MVAPKVITGIEALGRGHDFNKYMTAAREIILPLKEFLAEELNVKDFAERALVSLSIDTDGIWKSDEQKELDAQKQQQGRQGAMTQQMLMDAVKGGVGPMAKVAAEGLSSQLQGEPE